MSLFSKTTTAIFYNQHPKPIQRMLDFDYLCKRDTPSISAIVNPTNSGFHRAFFGTEEIIIPVFKSLEEASTAFPESDVLVNFASERSAYAVSKNALEYCPSIKTIHIMAEGISENKTRELIRIAKEKDVLLIGPATVGGIKPGAFRIGNTAGSLDNIIAAKLYRPGSVGVVTISGGMSSEIYNIVAQNTDGTYEGIAIGGDRFPGSTLFENIMRFENDREVKMIVALGEVGGTAELEIAEAVTSKKIKKPIVMWVTGTIADHMKTEVQFGHAGAKSGVENESASFKNAALKKAGVHVPKSFDTFGDLIKEVFEKEVLTDKHYKAPEDGNYNQVPTDFSAALKENIVRKSASIVSSISDDRGEEPTYNKIPISEYADKSIGRVINALWFKGKLPEVGEQFIELGIKLSADHGPAVGTAHNAIVSSRAGNNVIMSLIAGLTTIGPRHGGAIDGTALWCLDAVERDLSGKDVIAEHKQAGKLIMGIGHRIKTVQNPDKRVEILKDFIATNIKNSHYFSKALEVETETIKKKNNLILNVDGAIGAAFLDILAEANFTTDEIKEIVSLGALNAIFVLGRSIGIIGHALDQKRLKEPMYRHDWDDILYI
ncbi:ATP citrate synthase [Candidatus Dojkabacteria bacterium]|uniref:ATP citrate synthase n=1 Tax=Candidatus Dojkabacteria bacterium TaxID=2099670 RepID=A0A955L7M0_9BACT|nr:ATP citrate synthase [Candidatus Dojkabacteria bacterium]